MAIVSQGTESHVLVAECCVWNGHYLLVSVAEQHSIANWMSTRHSGMKPY